MATITWAINADFAKSGTAYGTALTDYVTNPGGRISLSRGLGKDGMYQVSRLTLTLNNSTGIFTPDNSAGSLYGMLEPEVPIQVTATYNSVEYAVWTGYIKSYRNTWASGQIAQCVVECEDISAFLWQFSPVNVTDAERTSGAAMTAIFAAMGLTSDDYDVATGAETFPHHWVRNTDGMAAAMEVLRSEMGGLLYVDGDGKLVFEGRDGRLGLRQFDRLIHRYGPAAAWRFGEASGATVYDYSGNANDMTLTNSPARAASLSGAFAGTPWDGGTDFEAGSSQYGTVTDHATLDTGDSFTWYYLFKLESLANQMVLSMKGANGLTVSVKTTGEVSLDKALVANIGDSSGAGIAAGEWNFVVVTKDGSTTKVYCNGADVSGSWANQTIENTGDDIAFGYYQPAGVLYFDGIMARAGTFDTALTAAQVLRLQRSRTGNTWGDGTSIFPRAIDYDLDDTDLVSTASVKAQIIVDSDPTQVVFGFSRNGETIGGRTADSMSLAAGAQYGPFEMDYARPILSLSTPVAGEDYKANSAADGKGTDLTADLSVTVTDLGAGFRATLKNTGASTLYVTKFELQGLPADALFDRPQFTTTKPITGNKTDLGVSILLAYANDDARPPKAQDYSHALASRYRWPYPRVTMAFDVNGATKLPAFLALELGDLVRYTDTALGVSQPTNVVAGASLDEWYYVEAIRMDAQVGEAIENIGVVVTLVPSWLYRDLDRIAYDLFARDNASGDLGTALSGDAWADDTGFDITSETARANTDTESIANVDLGALAFDHVVEVALAAIGTGDEVGLAFRYVDANNHYRAYLDKGSNEVILEKKIGGVVTEISSPAYTVGTTAELRVMVQGNRFRVWVGRRLYIDTTDAALNTGTKVGLWARNANATTTFDKFYAEAL